MTFQIQVNIKGLDLTQSTLKKIAKNGPKAANRASSKLAVFCARRARKNLKGPYSTGRTKVHKRGANGQYRVEATNPQGDAAVGSIEYGARPHLIPNNPQWSNRVHPGMVGKHFMGKAFDETLRKANRIIGQALREFKL